MSTAIPQRHRGGRTFGARVYWGPGPTYSTFTSLTTTPAVTSVAVGNITGHSPNGLLDVATSPGVQIYGQTGLRTFDPSGVTYTVPGGADVAVGDVTTDTRDDVVASRPANSGGGQAVQNGTGGLVAAADAKVASAPRPVAIADIDNDGANDIVVLHDSAPPGSRHRSDGCGRARRACSPRRRRFPVADFAPGYDAKALAVGDVEGDGRDDLVVATSFGLSLLVQNSGVLPTLAPAWITDAFPQSMATNVVASVHPTITFGRAVTNFDASKVQLRDASGAAVPSTPVYDSATHTDHDRAEPCASQRSLRDSCLRTHRRDRRDARRRRARLSRSAPRPTRPRPRRHSIPRRQAFDRRPRPRSRSRPTTRPRPVWCSFANEPYHVCGSPQHITGVAGHACVPRVCPRCSRATRIATHRRRDLDVRPPVHGLLDAGRRRFDLRVRFGAQSGERVDAPRRRLRHLADRIGLLAL